MNEQQMIAQLRQQALNVFGYAHKDDDEMVKLANEQKALYDSIAQPLEEINKKRQKYLEQFLPDVLQLKQEK